MDNLGQQFGQKNAHRRRSSTIVQRRTHPRSIATNTARKQIYFGSDRLSCQVGRSLPGTWSDGPDLCHVLLNEFFSRYGTPIQLHSDQGRNFESDLFAELCKLLEVRSTRTTPRNPRCNGQTERFKSTLIHMVKCYHKIRITSGTKM